MPIQYKGVIYEHHHVRSNVGVFDVSHMCQIMIRGDFAFDLVQKTTTNDVARLKDGGVQYSCMLNDNAGIIDDLLVYRIASNHYMLVVNASNAEKDFNWLCINNDFNVSIQNVTKDKGLLAVQGPNAQKLLQYLTPVNLESIAYYKFKIGVFADCEDIIISNTGYTGAGGFELYMNKEDCEQIWNQLFSTSIDLEPIGLAARDTLRLEMGYCLYGNDISEETSPIEAGLSWIVKLNKNFIGKKNVSQQLSKGVGRKLIAFILIDKGIPRQGYKIFNSDNKLIGEVTSGTMSPSLNKSIGMGYVLLSEAFEGNKIFLAIRNKQIKAIVVNRPFYAK